MAEKKYIASVQLTEHIGLQHWEVGQPITLKKLMERIHQNLKPAGKGKFFASQELSAVLGLKYGRPVSLKTVMRAVKPHIEEHFKAKFSVEPGRLISRKGHPYVCISRPGGPGAETMLSPTEADAVTHEIAYMLNGEKPGSLTGTLSSKRAGTFSVGPGRDVLRNGVPCINIGREGSTSPVEADEVAHRVAQMLNDLTWKGRNPEKAKCPLCSETVLCVEEHLRRDHENEIRQRRANPHDRVLEAYPKLRSGDLG